MAMNASCRESLILDPLPQVELLARRLHRRCPQVELDDLIQAGTIGLIQAVDRYDESRGCPLKTIAEHRIRGALLDYLRQSIRCHGTSVALRSSAMLQSPSPPVKG